MSSTGIPLGKFVAHSLQHMGGDKIAEFPPFSCGNGYYSFSPISLAPTLQIVPPVEIVPQYLTLILRKGVAVRDDCPAGIVPETPPVIH